MTSPPDIEAHLTALLSGIPATKVWAYTSSSRVRHILEETTVQVDSRAASKESAEERSHHARALILALPGKVWHDGIVSSVDEVTGPAWVPDQDGAPRYVFRCTITYRNTR